MQVGTKLGTYQVIAKLGEGGMGEVYRAIDTKLGRAVALKVLPPAMARDPERLARFDREARAVAALNHPHIVTLYSVEENEGIFFLTMELVEGDSLAAHITKGGLPLDRILGIGAAIADALAAAHHKGIVHRDLKPANVMLTADGRVKVLDFGLAKELRPADSSDATMTLAGHTEIGVVMGTPAYMSPEQLAGRPVDERTDIFSLGILLYEMVSGQPPFHGASSVELASAILRDTPRPLRDVPADMARLIQRCLEKDREARMHSARDVAVELQEIARGLSSAGRSKAAADSQASRAAEGFWIAVLPFRYSGSNADVKALAEGLSEETVAGLSRFPYLRVIARSSTAKYSSESRDVGAIGEELGARYVLEGSIRQVGTTIRVAAQLVDSATGAHLWADAYDRQFQPDQLFVLQDELVPRIVSTCGDHFGVLARSISEAVRSKAAGELTPYDAVMRGFGYHFRLSPGEHAAARDVLERAVEAAPANADCWAMLSWIYSHEFGHGFNPRPGSLDRALAAARRAVDLAPSNPLAYQTLAVALFFRKDHVACRSACERALALNPLDGSNEAMFLIAFMGDWKRGNSLIHRAMERNPHHPGWFVLMLAFEDYLATNYHEAIEEIAKANVPGFFWSSVLAAAAHGQLGDRRAARAALDDLLVQKPEFAESAADLIGRWFDPQPCEQFMDGLRKAGLQPSPRPATAASTAIESPRASDSGSRRTDEGFRVAVLPFKYGGSSAEVAGLADGLSEEIVTGLSRFSYLRVIARSSTSRYAGAATDVRTIASEIGARYVMEGSVRQSGTQLRIAVQMVDATDGAHLWAETYNRPFQADAIFDLQDELVPRIVSTVADGHGVLPRSMGEVLRGRSASELTPYEAVLRGCSFYARMGPAEHADVRAALERAAEQAPDHADVWALLSMLYQDEHRQGFNPRPDPLGRALTAARRAVDLGPSNHFAHFALASTLFFRRDLTAFRQAAERTIALNPMDGNSLASMGCQIAFAGDWTHGLELVDRAQRLNPHHPGWFWLPNFYNSYRVGDYAAALQAAAKVNMPAYFWAYVVTIAAQGQLGGRGAAGDALPQLLRLKPDIARTVRDDLQKWFVDEELVERLIDGLRKAGLDALTPSREVVTAPALDKGSGRVSTARSIAVLPFANMSADKDEDYFSDGLAEEIINLLAQASGLKVIARSSAFAFRGKDEDVRKIARALDVTHVLEGSVRRAGGRIRVTAQLISAADGGHVWSERYDREMRDVFALQDDIAEAIAKALRVRLSDEAPPRHVPALPAYEAYLRARHHQAKVTPEAWDLAKACFESAIELDPAFALAHVGLGYYWLGQVHFGRSPAHEAIPAARAAARRALGVDAALPEAHALLGILAAQYDLDFEAAERFFDAPMARQAGYPLTRPIYGGFLFLKGEGTRAIELAERTIAEDPLEVWPRMNLHAYLQAAGRNQEAYEQTLKALELNPNLVVARVSVAHFHADWGQLPEAVAAARKAVEVGPWYQDARATLAALLRVTGSEDEALPLQQSLGTGETPGDCRAQALYHLLCDDVETGADWVEKAIAERDGSMLYYLQFVVCRPLRASVRWRKIARMVNLPVVIQ